ncbi:MAG: hypothetical protein ABEK17_01690 [Candidatus Aenigmatarchaeota archaeon]
MAIDDWQKILAKGNLEKGKINKALEILGEGLEEKSEKLSETGEEIFRKDLQEARYCIENENPNYRSSLKFLKKATENFRSIAVASVLDIPMNKDKARKYDEYSSKVEETVEEIEERIYNSQNSNISSYMTEKIDELMNLVDE